MTSDREPGVEEHLAGQPPSEQPPSEQPMSGEGSDAAGEHPPGYPHRWETDAPLRDGGTVHIRPVRPDDAEAVAAFHERQSAGDLYYRYFTSMPRLTPRMRDRLTNVDYTERMGFVALLGDSIVGMASYDLWPERNTAELAFMVDVDHQGRGLATLLLEYLVVAAREAGVGSLVAMVLPDNRRMLNVFHKAGFAAGSTFEDGVIEVKLSLDASEASQEIIEERARRAEARSVARLLAPASIAVIGAGRERGGLGHELFRNLLRRGFEGVVYPVNPSGGHVASVRAWPSVVQIPDEIDMAVLAVPAERTLEVVEQCARKRVRGLVVTSAGFGPASPSGADIAARVVEEARRWGMRVIGPESLGMINTSPQVSMTATYAPVEVREGAVGLLTQSGTLGVAALEVARRKGVGISTFLDVGRKVDVSGNDVLQYWEEDEATSVAALYLESFGNPAKFVRIARRMGRTTPIVAVKAGNLRPASSTAWDRTPASRTGTVPAVGPGAPRSLDVSADLTWGALLAQAGVIRVDSLNDMMDVSRVLLDQPVPTGRRVAVISNSRGATTITHDAIAGASLQLATLSAETCSALAEVLPEGWQVADTIELPFDAGPHEYATATRVACDDPGVDAVVVIYAPATRDEHELVGEAIASVVDDRIPVLATFLGAAVDRPIEVEGTRIPLFELPGEAIRVLARLVTHGEWRAEPPGTVPEPEELGIDEEALRELLDQAVARCVPGPEGPEHWLDHDEMVRFVEATGLPAMPSRLAADPEAAVAAAEALGWPVVLKAKTDRPHFRALEGGVALDLRDPDDVRSAWAELTELHGEAAMAPARVQLMAAGGVDVHLATHRQTDLGALVSVGLGGIAAEGGAAQRPVWMLPLSDTDAVRLVERSPVAAPLAVSDPDGAAAISVASVTVRMAAILEHFAQVADIVANPVIASSAGARITEMRVRITPAHVDDTPAVRRLD